MRKNDKRISLRISILAAAIAAMPLVADAAGLGKISIQSALGQPLRAELEITASRDEISSLAARIAPVEAFRQANIDYVSALNGLRFTLDKRANGQTVFKITSERPINDPFLDFLVELNWSSGRLVREYTFLLDPPELGQGGGAVSTAVVAPVVNPEAVEKTAERPAEAKSPEVTATRPESSKSASAAEGKATAGAQRTVKEGDTLGRIAAELRPEGVSLDQMLVALFKSNASVFDAQNMNRLRAGKILTIPEAADVAGIDTAEAKKIIRAQSADFASYRKQLASAAASAPAIKQETPRQEAAGKITPKVEDKAPVVAGKDKLQVSRTEVAKAAPGGKPRNQEEDLVAREKALKEANSRIGDLEKNLGDLKKLAELKSKGGVELQKQAQAEAQKATSDSEQKPVIASPSAQAPASGQKAADEPSAQPKPEKKPVAPPPPGFMEANGPYVYGGGGLLALLVGFFGFKAWKRKRSSNAWGEPSGLSASNLAENSVFSVSAGQSIDTGGPVEPSDHSASDAGSGKPEGVDPLQEAEVYLAYGRDAQAEEILLDALKTSPTRLAIHGKLLEIYAARRSIPQFVTLAADVHEQTQGKGTDWEHALALGVALDPGNPLFGGKASSSSAPPEQGAVAAVEATKAPVEPVASAAPAEATMEAVPDTLDFDLDLAAASTEPEPAAVPQPEPAAEVAGDGGLDFDLGMEEPASESTSAPPATGPSVAKEAAAETNSLDIDFDLPDPGAESSAQPTQAAVTAAAAADTESIDFDLGDSMSPEAAAAASETTGKADSPLDFDFDLGEPSVPGSTPPAAVDLSSISLDLDQPLPAMGDSASASEDLPEVATKLELAQAYQEMGDKEGARELLQEVLKEGSAAQQETARSKLAALD